MSYVTFRFPTSNYWADPGGWDGVVAAPRLYDANYAGGFVPETPWWLCPTPGLYRHSSTRLSLDAGVREVVNDDKEFRVTLDVRHFKPEEITVKVINSRLHIHAKHDDRPDKDGGFIMREFTRRYLLPRDVDPDAVTSQIKDDRLITIVTKKAPIRGSEVNIAVDHVPTTDSSAGLFMVNTQDSKENNYLIVESTRNSIGGVAAVDKVEVAKDKAVEATDDDNKVEVAKDKQVEATDDDSKVEVAKDKQVEATGDDNEVEVAKDKQVEATGDDNEVEVAEDKAVEATDDDNEVEVAKDKQVEATGDDSKVEVAKDKQVEATGDDNKVEVAKDKQVEATGDDNEVEVAKDKQVEATGDDSKVEVAKDKQVEATGDDNKDEVAKDNNIEAKQN